MLARSHPQAGLQGRPPPSAYRKSLGPACTTFSDSSPDRPCSPWVLPGDSIWNCVRLFDDDILRQHQEPSQMIKATAGSMKDLRGWGPAPPGPAAEAVCTGPSKAAGTPAGQSLGAAVGVCFPTPPPGTLSLKEAGDTQGPVQAGHRTQQQGPTLCIPHLDPAATWAPQAWGQVHTITWAAAGSPDATAASGHHTHRP